MRTARGVLQSVTEASRAGTGNISNRSRRDPEHLVIAIQLWRCAFFIRRVRKLAQIEISQFGEGRREADEWWYRCLDTGSSIAGIKDSREDDISTTGGAVVLVTATATLFGRGVSKRTLHTVAR